MRRRHGCVGQVHPDLVVVPDRRRGGGQPLLCMLLPVQLHGAMLAGRDLHLLLDEGVWHEASAGESLLEVNVN
jgi:hypothetical protein